MFSFFGENMFQKIAFACVLALGAAAVSASQLPAYPFIHVTGDAMVRVRPDIGTIDFEIAASDADPAAARAVVEERVATVRALMEQQGLDPADVEVRDVRQEIAKPLPGATAPVYDTRCSVHINVRDLAQWPALAGSLLGMANLDSFAVAFDTTERDKIEAELMADSIRNARKQAAVIAAGFGRKLGTVSAVSSGALKNLGRAMGLAPADFAAPRRSRSQEVDRDNILEVVMIRLSQSVDVIFRIKQ